MTLNATSNEWRCAACEMPTEYPTPYPTQYPTKYPTIIPTLSPVTTSSTNNPTQFTTDSPTNSPHSGSISSTIISTRTRTTTLSDTSSITESSGATSSSRSTVTAYVSSILSSNSGGNNNNNHNNSDVSNGGNNANFVESELFYIMAGIIGALICLVCIIVIIFYFYNKSMKRYIKKYGVKKRTNTKGSTTSKDMDISTTSDFNASRLKTTDTIGTDCGDAYNYVISLPTTDTNTSGRNTPLSHDDIVDNPKPKARFKLSVTLSRKSKESGPGKENNSKNENKNKNSNKNKNKNKKGKGKNKNKRWSRAGKPLSEAPGQKISSIATASVSHDHNDKQIISNKEKQDGPLDDKLNQILSREAAFKIVQEEMVEIEKMRGSDGFVASDTPNKRAPVGAEKNEEKFGIGLNNSGGHNVLQNKINFKAQNEIYIGNYNVDRDSSYQVASESSRNGSLYNKIGNDDSNYTKPNRSVHLNKNNNRHGKNNSYYSNNNNINDNTYNNNNNHYSNNNSNRYNYNNNGSIVSNNNDMNGNGGEADVIESSDTASEGQRRELELMYDNEQFNQNRENTPQAAPIYNGNDNINNLRLNANAINDSTDVNGYRSEQYQNGDQIYAKDGVNKTTPTGKGKRKRKNKNTPRG